MDYHKLICCYYRTTDSENYHVDAMYCLTYKFQETDETAHSQEMVEKELLLGLKAHFDSLPEVSRLRFSVHTFSLSEHEEEHARAWISKNKFGYPWKIVKLFNEFQDVTVHSRIIHDDSNNDKAIMMVLPKLPQKVRVNALLDDVIETEFMDLREAFKIIPDVDKFEVTTVDLI